MNKAVADLIGVIKSPVLLNSQVLAGDGEFLSDAWCVNEILKHKAQLHALCDDPSELLVYLEANLKNYRLGYYFEALFGFWFRKIKKINRVYGNVPVRNEQQTLGEFDLIYSDHQNGRAHHLELAVKFYLCHSPAAQNNVSLSSYLGPNAKDRLDKKVDRLLNRQMKLASTLEGRLTLETHGFEIERSYALVKGGLFYPLDSDWRSHPAPKEVSPEHERGWWCSLSRLAAFDQNSNLRWAILNRNEWITPDLAAHVSKDRLLSARQIFEVLTLHFAEGKSSLMVAEFNLAEQESPLFISKGFIVPDLWPQLLLSV